MTIEEINIGNMQNLFVFTSNVAVVV